MRPPGQLLFPAHPHLLRLGTEAIRFVCDGICARELRDICYVSTVLGSDFTVCIACATRANPSRLRIGEEGVPAPQSKPARKDKRPIDEVLRDARIKGVTSLTVPELKQVLALHKGRRSGNKSELAHRVGVLLKLDAPPPRKTPYQLEEERQEEQRQEEQRLRNAQWAAQWQAERNAGAADRAAKKAAQVQRFAERIEAGSKLQEANVVWVLTTIVHPESLRDPDRVKTDLFPTEHAALQAASHAIGSVYGYSFGEVVDSCDRGWFNGFEWKEGASWRPDDSEHTEVKWERRGLNAHRETAIKVSTQQSAAFFNLVLTGISTIRLLGMEESFGASEGLHNDEGGDDSPSSRNTAITVSSPFEVFTVLAGMPPKGFVLKESFGVPNHEAGPVLTSLRIFEMERNQNIQTFK